VTFHNYGKLENNGISPWKTGINRGNLTLTARALSTKSRKCSVKDNERRRQRRFQLSLATTLHIRSSRSTRARIFIVVLGALGARRRMSYATNRFRE